MRGHVTRIRALKEDDIEEIAKLKLEQGDTSNRWRNRFGWQFANNPARLRERPLGWVIETGDGFIKGHQMAIPHRFSIFNTEQYVGFSADTYVSPDLRGQGLGVRLFEVYFKAQEGGLGLTSSADPASQYIWEKKLGAFPIGDLNKCFLFVFRYGPVLKEALIKWFGQLVFLRSVVPIMGIIGDHFLVKRLPQMPVSITCEKVEPHDSVLDDLWQQYRSEYRITVVRDRVYRVWRYKDAPEPKPSIWFIQDSQRNLGGWFSFRVAVRGQAQVKICELLDVFGPTQDPQFQKHVLACAVHRGYESGADAMEIKGLHPSWRSQVSSLGFFNRLLPSNPFLCRNACNMEKRNLLNAMNWHLCTADGDAGL
jgi:GNAT superfamily N-acetyltransferase